MKPIMLRYEMMWFETANGCMDMYDYKRSADTEKDGEMMSEER